MSLRRSRCSLIDSINETKTEALQWVKLGKNDNVSGYCDSGELFAFLSAPSPDNDALCSKMLRQVSGEDGSARLTSRAQSNANIASSFASSTMSPSKRLDIDLALANSEGHGALFLGGNYINKDTVHRRFSYIESSQALQLYLSLTVLETLCFSAELRVKTHTQPVELSVLRLLTEMGFKDWAELRVLHLSEWQRRMLLFATEAIAGKDVIFFDLPTTDLDTTSALAMVTALQRAARGGRLVCISLVSLTFREYAMLDNVQLLSSKGSLYLGSGANAANYFRQLDRTPSPGASITDFLLDLVDDDMWPGGYADAHLTYLETVAEKRGLEQVAQSARRSSGITTNIAQPSFGANRSSSGALEVTHDNIPVRAPRIALSEEMQSFAGDSFNGYGALPCDEESEEKRMQLSSVSSQSPLSPPRSPQPHILSSIFVQGKIADAGTVMSESAVYVYNSFLSPGAAAAASGVETLLQTPLKTPTFEGAPLQLLPETKGLSEEHSLGTFLDSISEWTRNNEFLEEDVDDCFPSWSSADGTSAFSQVVLQFSQCFWRAVVIRKRNMQQVMATWAFIGLQVIIGFGLLFSASGASDSVSFLRSRATFLIALPFSLVLLANNWNEYSEKDRNVVTYESCRAYFRYPVVSPIASLIADIIIFHLPPCIIASSVLYPIVGLSNGIEYFFVYLRSMILMMVTACCVSRAIAGGLALSSRIGTQEDMRPKSNLVTTFVFSIFFLYSGLLLETDVGIGFFHTFMRTCSFFYYGCNILLWNEFGHSMGEVESGYDSALSSFLKSRHVARQDRTYASAILCVMIVISIVTVGFFNVIRLKRIRNARKCV